MPVPTAPTNLTATAISSSRIDLAWTDNSADETGFVLQRSLNGIDGWATIVTTAANATSYSDTGRNSNTQFFYWVKATNGSGDSSFTPVAYATTFNAATAYGYLTVLAADALAAARAGLTAFKAATWTAKAQGLQSGFDRVELAYRLQGRKYGPEIGVAQAAEFPRIARGSIVGGMLLSGAAGLSGEIWDWDVVNNIAVPPLNVKLAQLYEANAILVGTRDARQEAMHDGLAAQSVDGLSESYLATAVTASGKPKLCLDADRLVVGYRLTSGALL